MMLSVKKLHALLGAMFLENGSISWKQTGIIGGTITATSESGLNSRQSRFWPFTTNIRINSAFWTGRRRF